MGSVLFFVVSSAAKQTQTEVIQNQKTNQLGNPTVTKAIFSLGDPAFRNDPHSCNPPFTDYAYLNVHMRYQQVPSSCTTFVNQKYLSTERSLQPECIGQCPYKEFSRTFSLGALDVREDHVLRVCCNDICIEKLLPRACTIPTNQE